MRVQYWLGVIVLCSATFAMSAMFTARPLWGTAATAVSLGYLFVAYSGAAAGSRSWNPIFVRPQWKPALRFAATLLACQFFAIQLLEGIAANHHDLPVVSALLRPLAQILGISSSRDGATLFFQTEEDVLPFATNWEKFGFVMPIGLAFAVVLSALPGEERLRTRVLRMVAGLVALTGFLLVRYLALCVVLIEFGNAKGTDEHERLTWFTGFWPTLISHAPFAFLMAGLGGAGRHPLQAYAVRTAPALRERLGTSFAVAIAVCVTVFATKLEMPGSVRQGDVVVDDYHSGFWEPSTPTLTTAGFGSDHLYNASSLVEWLRYHRRVHINSAQPITDELLRGVAVYVLKTPTRRLTQSEIECLLRFVRSGGGLLLIGDHTNLLGMSSYLNELASHFGIRFEHDGSNAYSSGYFSSYRSPRLLAHPVVQGLDEIRFLTSCTLRLSEGATPLMIGRDLISDPVDYSKPSFFGKLNPSPQNGFGLFPLAATSSYGEGRVVAYAESTTMSNFAVFQDDTAAFFLGAINYLSKQQKGSGGLAVIWFAMAVCFAAFAIWRTFRNRQQMMFSEWVVGASAGFLGGAIVLWIVHQRGFEPPAVISPPGEVAFLRDETFNYHVPPAIGPSFFPETHSFDSLFVIPQRFGWFPRFAVISQLSTNRFTCAVAVNPSEPLELRVLRRVAAFVSSGGRLLVLQDPAGDTRFLASLKSELGVGIAAEPKGHRELLIAPESSSITIVTNSALLGETNVSALYDVKPIPAWKVTWTKWSAGRGELHVVSDASAFSRAVLGNVMAEPTSAQRVVYANAFEVFSEFLPPRKRPDESIWNEIPTLSPE